MKGFFFFYCLFSTFCFCLCIWIEATLCFFLHFHKNVGKYGKILVIRHYSDCDIWKIWLYIKIKENPILLPLDSYLQTWKKCHFSKYVPSQRSQKQNTTRRNKKWGTWVTKRSIGLISMCWCGEIDSASRHCHLWMCRKRKIGICWCQIMCWHNR